ncbi:MAG: LysR family transcriptional regulator [Telmatospirillum sp.]|nr:LysR family transcriptional regulator [Telmatospirillum sp.]
MRRNLPSLVELIAFESAARHGSFTRAAEELNLTQGAISRQIRGLEEAVDTRLFVRVRRSVILTDAGRLYLADIRTILENLSVAAERVTTFGADHVLNLAVLPTMATRWLVPRIPDFCAKHPGVILNFTSKVEPFSFDAEPFDAAIHFGDNNWPGARVRFLCKEEIVAAASPATILRDRVRTPRDVLRTTLLHQTTRTNAWDDWLLHQGVETGARLKGPRFDQFGMIAEAAVAGLGIALVPRFLVEAELSSGRLVALDAKPTESDSAYWFVIPDRKFGEPLISAFSDWIADQARGSKEWPIKRNRAKQKPADRSPGGGLA